MSSEWVAASFKPVEPLALRGPGEILTGSWLNHIPLPLPTTLLGSIASKLIGEIEAVKGPFLKKGEGWYLWAGRGLVELDPDGISDWVNRQKRGERAGKRARETKHKLFLGGDLISVMERISASLYRGKKLVREREGALFGVPYVELKGEIIMDFLVKEKRNESMTIVVRLGGEDRVARAELPYAVTLYSWLEDQWTSEREALLLVGSPLLLESVEDPVESFIREVERIKGVDWVEDDLYSVHRLVRATIAPFYPGFDEVKGKKESLRTALLPGAVFHVKVDSWEEVYRSGAGLYREVGYGTLVPLPVVSN